MTKAEDHTQSPHSPPINPTVSWTALAIAGIAQMLVMLDSTVVNVALPSIGDDLNASAITLQWTISGYVLTYGALLLFGGRLADTIGRRRSFIAGLLVFGSSSAACGFAGTGEMLVAGRIVQGVGAALLSASALSIIVATYGAVQAQLNIALAAWSALGVIGATIGVIMGGVIVHAWSWQWAFLINLPIVAVVIIAAVAKLDAMPSQLRQSLKLPTAIVATLGVGLLCYGMSRFEEGWTNPLPWALLVLGVVVLIGLFRFEDKALDPLLPVSLLRTPIYAWAGFGLVLAATLMLGALYLASNYLQQAHGLSPLSTGVALLPLCGGSLISAFAVPGIAGRIGMARLYLGGVVAQLLALTIIIVTTADGTGNSIIVICALAVFGLGLPTMFVPLYTFGSAPIPAEKSGVGSGLLNTFNEAGSGVGLAIVAPVFASTVASHLSSGGAAPLASAAGTHAGFWVLGGVACLALVTAIVLTRIHSQPEDVSG
ncbi:MFS transporter [Corynebacterium sp. AOP12-C2-36]|uniref:MFS transporter n=1 Tax=Corynebacterium sp. AOP12-C2-36 TaxID=3457723 RepID=UPI0040338B1D